MRLTEQEIVVAVGHPVAIFTVNNTRESNLRFTEITDTPGGLWKSDTEEEAKAKLLKRIAERADNCRSITFRDWPEVRSRPDGKCSGHTRVAFT